MPAAPRRNTIARQWELLGCLPSTMPGKSSAELTQTLAAAGYRVDKRTVERDLAELEQLFGVARDAATLPHRWYRTRGSRLDLWSLSSEAALSLALLDRSLKPLLPHEIARQLQPLFQLAKTKLATLREENALFRWPEKVAAVDPALPVSVAKPNEQILETVQQALLADETLSVKYSAPGKPEPKDHILHPLGLTLRGPVLYLVATAQNDKPAKPMLFAIHRMRSAERRHEPGDRPKGFSLQAFIDEGGMQFGTEGGRMIEMLAWVTENLATQLQDARIADNQQLEDANGGRTMLRATLPDTWQLRWWILSKGHNIEVLGPMELRNAIAETLANAANLYRLNTTPK